jgi:hypothetical protein
MATSGKYRAGDTMLLEHIERLGKGETTWLQLAILMYELGDLAKGIVYRERHPDCADVWTIEAKVALSDLVAQTIIICEREGWNFEEVKRLGIERCIEKIARHIEKGE